jgi:predicted ester cyclase
LLDGGDLRQLDELCTPDLVNHSLAPGRPAGLEGTREFLTTQGRQFRSTRWQELTVVIEGDLLVQYGIRTGHWPGGSFRGIEIPPGPYSREFAVKYRFVDGRIAERWAVRDDLGMMQQLGALPS